MIVTQGVFKYTNVYGITFENKYAGIKTILSNDDYKSKFEDNIYEITSQTSTVLVDDDSYFNIVDECTLINCNVENGRFTKCKIIGNSGKTNYINDGVFSGCTFTNYIINGGRFIDCVMDSTNKWNTGYWENNQGNINFTTIWIDGVWNSGVFNNPYGWSGGTFNGGTFVSPAIWYDGVANGGTFSGITWHNGLVRNADFIDNCTFNDGTFNNGNFIDSTFNGGIFNNGNLINSSINNGIINDGYISSCDVSGTTEINGGTFADDTIYYCNVHNIDATNLSVNGGNFYNGTYNNSTFLGGEIFNGTYSNINGQSLNLTIHNGTFRNSIFNYINIQNGNFTNCESNNVFWDYGVYTDGKMFNSIWKNGYWNDGLFESITNTNIKIDTITVDVNTTTTTTILPTTTTSTTLAPITTTSTTSPPLTTTTTTLEYSYDFRCLSICQVDCVTAEYIASPSTDISTLIKAGDRLYAVSGVTLSDTNIYVYSVSSPDEIVFTKSIDDPYNPIIHIGDIFTIISASGPSPTTTTTTTLSWTCYNVYNAGGGATGFIYINKYGASAYVPISYYQTIYGLQVHSYATQSYFSVTPCSTPTTTTTTTSAPLNCYCYDVYNVGGGTSYFYYKDCNGVSSSIYINYGTTAYSVEISSYSYQSDFVVTTCSVY